MKWSEFFTSSVGKKWVMALTGIFLILFLVIHVGLNACTAARPAWAGSGRPRRAAAGASPATPRSTRRGAAPPSVGARGRGRRQDRGCDHARDPVDVRVGELVVERRVRGPGGTPPRHAAGAALHRGVLRDRLAVRRQGVERARLDALGRELPCDAVALRQEQGEREGRDRGAVERLDELDAGRGEPLA